MAVTVFKDSSYNLAGLISYIQNGQIGLPDIQRPFVWSNAKVRDLFDSMYKGFPVGYLLLWGTGAEVGTKQIGTDSKQSAPSLLIVDGQQRLTSLYAVITGTPVVRKDYSEGKIRVAFRPADMTFDVTDAAEYIASNSLTQSGSPALVKLIAKVSKYFGFQVTQKAAAQAIPAIGSAGGALINTMFIDHYQDMARGHFTVRRLERIYGDRKIRAAYDALPTSLTETTQTQQHTILERSA